VSGSVSLCGRRQSAERSTEQWTVPCKETKRAREITQHDGFGSISPSVDFSLTPILFHFSVEQSALNNNWTNSTTFSCAVPRWDGTYSRWRTRCTPCSVYDSISYIAFDWKDICQAALTTTIRRYLLSSHSNIGISQVQENIFYFQAPQGVFDTLLPRVPMSGKKARRYRMCGP